VKLLAVTVALLLAATASNGRAQDASLAGLEELRQRAIRAVTGTVEGRVYLERRRPNEPDEALAGVSVIVVPRQRELVDRLETVKRQSRDSMRGFREAAPLVRAILEEYESELWRAGYPDAAVRTASDGDGVFRATVPAGAWLVAVTRTVFLPLDSTPPGAPPRTASALDPLARYSLSQYQHFLPTVRVTGFDAVSVWLRDADVERGQKIALDLHDRGVWLSGVVEETTVPRRARFLGGARQR
jgi:hypothetical protein